MDTRSRNNKISASRANKKPALGTRLARTSASIGGALLLLFANAVAAEESSYSIVSQNGFSAAATLMPCSGGCSRQLAVTGRFEFVFDGNYSALVEQLEQFSMRISVYDGEWQDAEAGDVVMKVSSTIHQRQRWRRANMRRKMDTPAEMASAIYAIAPVGTVVTLEFEQTPVPLIGGDFTINARRYHGENLLATGSRAVAPVAEGGGHNTYVE